MNNVIITGTSNGFGQLSAIAFAEQGYRVWATMRNAAGSNRERKELLEAAAGDIRVLDMDVADDASVEAAIAQVIEADGKVDVLINNAGIMYIGHTEAYSLEQAHEQMNVNYFGVIRTTQAVLPAMRRAGSGLIINTSSTAGRVAYPYFGTYGATKFAVEAYSQSLRYEMAPHGIDIALVEPGPFPTNLINSVQPEARRDVLDDYGPLTRRPGRHARLLRRLLHHRRRPRQRTRRRRLPGVGGRRARTAPDPDPRRHRARGPRTQPPLPTNPGQRRERTRTDRRTGPAMTHDRERPRNRRPVIHENAEVPHG